MHRKLKGHKVQMLTEAKGLIEMKGYCNSEGRGVTMMASKRERAGQG